MQGRTIYFISGVSGVGKTSVMEHLQFLVPDSFEVHDFDETGVPTNADHEWRKRRTRQWIKEGEEKLNKGKGFIICGVAHPEEIEAMKKDFPSVDVEIILLDADDDVIEERLRDRNKDKKVRDDLERATGDAEAFIRNNRNFTPVLREVCKRHKCSIINTTHISPKEVAEEVVLLIQ